MTKDTSLVDLAQEGADIGYVTMRFLGYEGDFSDQVSDQSLEQLSSGEEEE